jgi:acetyl-CoA carboxylase alpha subunit
LLRSGISSLLKRRRMSEQNMRAVVKSLSYRGKRTLTKNFEKTLVLQKYQSLKTSKRTTAKSYLKYLGSKSFNDKVVQRAQ